jgi:hypothetical protein
MTWAPDLPAALVLAAMMLGMFARELRTFLFERRFWSPERRRIENVSRWWTERAGGER